MKCTTHEYTRHFCKFSDRLFLLHAEGQLQNLTKDEHFLLKNYGLPDCGLPFFRFDLSLQYLREIVIEEALFVLGSPINNTTNEYIFIAKDHSIKVMDEDGKIYFLNSSLKQLINCIYTYSVWLEHIEVMSKITGRPKVNNQDIFDIYYALRQEDKRALSGQSIWHEIVNTEILLPTGSPELV